MKLDYKSSGVDINKAEQTKKNMKNALEPTDSRVLNRLGAFSSLFKLDFPDIDDPVLVLKMEEPGSKQLLAIDRGSYRSIAYDTVHHIINDIMVMGAIPLAMLDVIICNYIEVSIVGELVDSFADACREQQCTLVGGETSEQPGILDLGHYVLAASAFGVVSERQIIDGSKINPGDAIIAVASNGFHTNGYTLLRKLFEQQPDSMNQIVKGRPFIERALFPHLCYGPGLRKLFEFDRGVHGLSHITGGGIRNNLQRILPNFVDAIIDLSTIQTLDVFSFVKDRGGISDLEMLNVFNCGVGLVCVVGRQITEMTLNTWNSIGFNAYVVGRILKGSGKVFFEGNL